MQLCVGVCPSGGLRPSTLISVRAHPVTSGTETLFVKTLLPPDRNDMLLRSLEDCLCFDLEPGADMDAERKRWSCLRAVSLKSWNGNMFFFPSKLESVRIRPDTSDMEATPFKAVLASDPTDVLLRSPENCLRLQGTDGTDLEPRGTREADRERISRSPAKFWRGGPCFLSGLVSGRLRPFTSDTEAEETLFAKAVLASDSTDALLRSPVDLHDSDSEPRAEWETEGRRRSRSCGG